MYTCATFGLVVFFRGVFLSSRVTGACAVTTDLIMRVNVTTTATTTTTTTTVACAAHGRLLFLLGLISSVSCALTTFYRACVARFVVFWPSYMLVDRRSAC